MDIRSLFGGLGESVLPGLIDGEERNLSRYDGVLGDAAQRAAPVRELLRAQRDRISLRVAAMRAEWAQAKAAT